MPSYIENVMRKAVQIWPTIRKRDENVNQRKPWPNEGLRMILDQGWGLGLAIRKCDVLHVSHTTTFFQTLVALFSRGKSASDRFRRQGEQHE